MLVFSTWPGERPVLAILPCLEILIAAQPRDDGDGIGDLWQALTEPRDGVLRYAYDNVRWRGELKEMPASQDRSMKAAFRETTLGPANWAARGTRPTDWASCAFVDSANPEVLPVTAVYCTLGWANGLGMRGVSLRVTGSPEDDTWASLGKLARDIAASAKPIWRWMTLGYRFVPISVHSAGLAGALTMIHQRSHRFLGVDVGDVTGLYVSTALDQLRSVGFLTLLSPALVERHQIVVPASLDPQVQTSEINGALVIQADHFPSLLDVNRLESTSAYRIADALCGSARARNRMNFFAPWNEESTASWLDRFRIT